MIEQNHALLAKWWWRFSREKDSLWAKVVCRKYGFSHQDWLPQLPSSGRVSIIRRDICSIGNPDSEMGNIIQAGFKLQVYSGNNTLFWNHKWMGDQTLREEFPRLYLKSSQKDELYMIFGKLESLWRNLSPLKVEILSWMACQGRIATRSILSSRNIIVGVDDHALACPFCMMELETPVHVLLSCPFSTYIWTKIVDWWNLAWVDPSSLLELSSWWFSSRFKNLEKYLWECCFYATLWSIWIARNDIIFNNKDVDRNQVEELIKTRTALWIKAKFDIKVYTVEDIKRNLDGVRRLKI
ncbi:hypothetical protein RHMOL_Rhmol08G0110300 [Rhododendron molle]|uniref:Uncharacterized protein n=1 Tax=Rhododendron molle TaxID=49168 RepID=A0ACC0MMT3_RHOML|nr:hypothetical protein RHMOL_Rhmol08G0110300 [Rhododendron molle]